MKRTGALPLLFLSAACLAQTPAELDAYYAAKAAADAANQVVVRANADSIAQIRTLLATQDIRLIALDTKLNDALATLKVLQSQPGVTTQQVIDALVAKLSAP